MKPSRRSKSTVAQQAAEWTEILKNANSHERALFDEWLTESPQHVREFLLMSAVDRALDSVDSLRAHDVKALLAQAKHDSVASIDSYRQSPSPNTPRRLTMSWRWAAIAAATALCVMVIWQTWQVSRWRDFRTEIGEQRTLQLVDGTVVSLDAQSHLQARFTAHARDLRLLQGQALFKVSHDPDRPFRVQAGESLIQAVGTQFDIYRRADASITVAVVEGRVNVSGPTYFAASAPEQAANNLLSAGEEVSLAPDGKVRERASVDKASTMAWHQRRLIFRHDTLARVIEEFNRYNRKPQIRLDGAAIGSRHYSGEFDADDPGSLVDLLAHDTDLLVDRQDGEIVIRPR